MAYNIAFDKEGIKGLYKLFSNILLTVEANSDPNNFIDGFVRHTQSKNDESAKQFYTRSWVPSAQALMEVTDEFNILLDCIRDVLEKFKNFSRLIMSAYSAEGFPRVVVCPNCGQKILATRPHMPPPSFYPLKRIHYVFTSSPPYHAVYCTACEH